MHKIDYGGGSLFAVATPEKGISRKKKKKKKKNKN